VAGVVAYALIRTAIGAEQKVAAEVKKLPGVTEVVVTYGVYDVVARIEAESLRELDETITRIRSLPEVVETVTLVGTPA